MMHWLVVESSTGVLHLTMENDRTVFCGRSRGAWQLWGIPQAVAYFMADEKRCEQCAAKAHQLRRHTRAVKVKR